MCSPSRLQGQAVVMVVLRCRWPEHRRPVHHQLHVDGRGTSGQPPLSTQARTWLPEPQVQQQEQQQEHTHEAGF
jgi:hypothetical protein